MSALFWNSQERRFRAFFRILGFLILASLFASLTGIVLEGINELLEKSLLNLFIMIAILAGMYLAGIFLDKRNWSSFGITLLPSKSFLTGSLTGAFLILFIFGIQYFLGWLSVKSIQFNTLAEYSFLIVFLGQVIRYLCGSVFEEAFSRAYLLKNMAEGFDGPVSRVRAIGLAYLISSVLFGVLHLFNDHATWISSLNLSLLGLLFGWPVLKTGKLHFSIALHAFWNIFQNNIFGAPNSGKPPVASLFVFENQGNTLWTGGEFGPEGGLICTLVLTCLLSYLILPCLIGIKPFPQTILKS